MAGFRPRVAFRCSGAFPCLGVFRCWGVFPCWDAFPCLVASTVESRGYSDEQMVEPPVSMAGSSTEIGWPRDVNSHLHRDRHHHRGRHREPLVLQTARDWQVPGTTNRRSVVSRFSYQHL